MEQPTGLVWTFDRVSRSFRQIHAADELLDFSQLLRNGKVFFRHDNPPHWGAGSHWLPIGWGETKKEALDRHNDILADEITQHETAIHRLRVEMDGLSRISVE